MRCIDFGQTRQDNTDRLDMKYTACHWLELTLYMSSYFRKRTFESMRCSQNSCTCSNQDPYPTVGKQRERQLMHEGETPAPISIQRLSHLHLSFMKRRQNSWKVPLQLMVLRERWNWQQDTTRSFGFRAMQITWRTHTILDCRLKIFPLVSCSTGQVYYGEAGE